MKFHSDESPGEAQNKLLSKLGSFWLDYLEDPDQARGLAAAAQNTTILTQLEDALKALINEKDTELKDFSVRFDKQKVVRAQSKSGDLESLVYIAEEEFRHIKSILKTSNISKYDGVASGSSNYYLRKDDCIAQKVGPEGLQKIDVNFKILSIYSEEYGRLLLNLDFFETDNFYVFRADPRVLFKNNSILVASADASIKSIYRFPLRQDTIWHLKRAKYLSRYARFEQSLRSFELALASVTGQEILEKDSEVLDKTKGSTNYILDTGILNINYEHEELEIGSSYEKDTIVGSGVLVHRKRTNTDKWWRRVSWGQGLDLYHITDYSGIIVQNTIEPVIAKKEIIDGVARWFISFDLLGPATDATKAEYWDSVHAFEKESGEYITDALGITDRLDAGETVYLNPLDLFFEIVLGDTSVVVEINATKVPDVDNALKYLQQELPVGAASITLIHVSVEDKISGGDIIDRIELSGDYVTVVELDPAPVLSVPLHSSSSSVSSSSSSCSSSISSSSISSSSSFSSSSISSSTSSDSSISSSTRSSHSSSKSSSSSVSSSSESSSRSSSSSYSSASSDSSISSSTSSQSSSSSESSSQTPVQGYKECFPYSSSSSDSSRSSSSSSSSSVSSSSSSYSSSSFSSFSSNSSSSNSSSSSSSSTSSSSSSTSSSSSSSNSSRSSSYSSSSTSSSSSKSSSSSSYSRSSFSSESSSSSSSKSSSSSSSSSSSVSSSISSYSSSSFSSSSSSLSSSKSSISSSSSSRSSSSSPSSSSYSSSSTSSSSSSTSSSSSSISSSSSSSSASSESSSSSSDTIVSFCGQGFKDNYAIINGSYVRITNPISGTPFLHNERYLYQNANKVTIYFTGATWAIDLSHNPEINEDLIERGPEDVDTWNPSGLYYPGVTGSWVGAILEYNCSSSSISSKSSSKSSMSSVSSYSSNSSGSSSRTIGQGYSLCIGATDVHIGNFGDFSKNNEFLSNAGLVAFLLDQKSILVSKGDGTFKTYPNVLGSLYHVGLEREILRTASPIGSVFLATDTGQLLVSDGQGGYVAHGDSTLPAYCADGFSGEYTIVNGTYQTVKDNIDNTLFYNGKPYYKNENLVTLFFNDSGRWAFDLSENTEITTDFIEKPEDSTGPDGNYYLSDIGAFFGVVTVGVCPEQSSSSSVTPATTVYAGGVVDLLPTSVSKRFRLNTEVGDVVVFNIEESPGVRSRYSLAVQHGSLAPNNTDIAILDPIGTYGGPFTLSVGQSKVLVIGGKNINITFVEIGSLILEYRLHEYVVYNADSCDL